MLNLDTLMCYRSDRGIQWSHLWLCCTPLVFRALDYGLTLCGQPAAYWQGDYHLAREGSTVLLWCLRLHPLAFVAASVLLSAVFFVFILAWPVKPARLLAAVLALGHIYGIATWVLPSGSLGQVACVALLDRFWSLTDTTWKMQRKSERLETKTQLACC